MLFHILYEIFVYYEEALKNALASGFLRYGTLGIRLEPDAYSRPNNQQDWWDDEHFRRPYLSAKSKATGGQLLPPLDSIEKWGKAIRAEGGVPLIYSQTGRALSSDIRLEN